MPDQSRYIAGVGASLSADGQEASINFRQNNGAETQVFFPAAAASSVLLSTEQAIGQLFEMQRAALKGEDPRSFFAIGAKRVKTVQGAIAQGVPVVSLVLESNVRLDFALDRNLCRELADWLSGLANLQDPGPQTRN